MVGVTDALLKGLALIGHFASFALDVVKNIPTTLRALPQRDAPPAQGHRVGQRRAARRRRHDRHHGAAVARRPAPRSASRASAAWSSSVSSPLTGFISASANTRELAPLIAALALGAQVGCRFTAQIGSMKIHEEIDALEVMAVDPMRYLVTTRVIACMLAILPLYLIGLIGSYIASQLSVVFLFDQSPGPVRPLLLDVHPRPRRLLVGGQDPDLRARDRPDPLLVRHQGRRRPAGGRRGHRRGDPRQHRVVVVLDMVLTLVFWGGDPGFRISG